MCASKISKKSNKTMIWPHNNTNTSVFLCIPNTRIFKTNFYSAYVLRVILMSGMAKQYTLTELKSEKTMVQKKQNLCW